MKNWKRLFAPIILNRGYEYYMDDLVEDLHRDGDTIYATVSGTEDYEVEITLDGEEVEDMFCTCPYADDGNYCKHMAAVLFEYEDKEAELKEDAGDDIGELVRSISEADVRSFLTEVLANDEKLKQRFIIRFSKKQRSRIDDYKKLVDETIYCHEDDYGFIDYEEAYELEEDMGSFVDDIRSLIEEGAYCEAFELSLHICQKVSELEIDDDGTIDTLMDEFSAFWNEIAEKMEPQDKDWLFDQALLEYELSDGDYLDEYLESFILRQFREERYRGRVMDFLDSQIERAQPDTYGKSAALRQKIVFLNEIGTGFDEIEKFCRDHWDDIHIREWLARQLIQREEWNKAIEIYEECVSSDHDYPGYVKGFREELLRLYRRTDNRKKVLQTLWDLVCKSNSTEYYKELKSQYSSEEWLIEREKVFPCFGAGGQAQLLCEEKLYDRLWELLNDRDLYTVLGYEDVLLPKYSAEILKKYQNYLNRAATQASGRSAYQDWVRLLKRMEKIDGGKEIAQQIADEWRVKYKNRRAMMEELRKL